MKKTTAILVTIYLFKQAFPYVVKALRDSDEVDLHDIVLEKTTGFSGKLTLLGIKFMSNGKEAL